MKGTIGPANGSLAAISILCTASQTGSGLPSEPRAHHRQTGSQERHLPEGSLPDHVSPAAREQVVQDLAEHFAQDRLTLPSTRLVEWAFAPIGRRPCAPSETDSARGAVCSALDGRGVRPDAGGNQGRHEGEELPGAHVGRRQARDLDRPGPDTRLRLHGWHRSRPPRRDADGASDRHLGLRPHGRRGDHRPPDVGSRATASHHGRVRRSGSGSCLTTLTRR